MNKLSYEIQYARLLKKVMDEGVLEANERTGHSTRRISGTIISCDLRQEWPLLTMRKMYPKTGAAELAWMLMGTQDGAWLKKYSKIWTKFEEDGLLKSAYGYRWRKHFGRDQIIELCRMLARDPSSRQGVVFAWDPATDGLDNSGKSKNIPCHMGFQALVIGGRLDIVVYQRSVDSVVGLPYDIVLYGLLNDAMAKLLGVQSGVVSIAFGDTHIYDSHFGIASELIRSAETPHVPIDNGPYVGSGGNTVEDIILFPDKFVADVVEAFGGFEYSNYAPVPEVIV